MTRNGTIGRAVKGWQRRVCSALVWAIVAPASLAVADGSSMSDSVLPPAWTAAGWQPPAEQFDVDLETVSVRMDDGVMLRADVIYPVDRSTHHRAAGAYPVLLEQTPYRWAGFANTSAVIARGRYFVSRGYIYVLAHQRGTADSGGKYDLLGARESADGKNLVEWASRFAGSDGRLGLVGCSADGLNQFLTAARLGPGSPVRAMAANGIGDNLYTEPVFPGGMYSAEGDWIFDKVVSGMGTESSIRASLDVLGSMRSGGDKALLSDYWTGISAVSAVEQVVKNDIPVLLYSGWEDVYPSSPYLMAMLQNAKAGHSIYAPFMPDSKQGGSPRYQIIMATGRHCTGDHGGARDQANFRWFETWIRGAPTGLASIKTPFHFHSMNSPGWLSFTSAPQSTHYTTLSLAAGGKLALASSGSRLDAVKLTYGNKEGGSSNATFTSEPLAATSYLAGAAVLTVTVQTSSPDLLLIADLYDVAPDGTETRLSRGDLLGSMRTPLASQDWRLAGGQLVRPAHDFTKAVAVTSDQPLDLSLALQPRLALIQQGHELRLILKSRSDPTTGDCHLELGPYPCLIGTLPQQRALIDSSYSVQLGQLSVPLATPEEGARPKRGS